MFDINIAENKVLGPVYLKGEHQGQLRLLRRQIERRFPNPPAWVNDKLSQLSIEELEAIGTRVLDAATPEELFTR